jgi:hypothetical protein
LIGSCSGGSVDIAAATLVCAGLGVGGGGTLGIGGFSVGNLGVSTGLDASLGGSVLFGSEGFVVRCGGGGGGVNVGGASTFFLNNPNKLFSPLPKIFVVCNFKKVFNAKIYIA